MTADTPKTPGKPIRIPEPFEDALRDLLAAGPHPEPAKPEKAEPEAK